MNAYVISYTKVGGTRKQQEEVWQEKVHKHTLQQALNHFLLNNQGVKPIAVVKVPE